MVLALVSISLIYKKLYINKYFTFLLDGKLLACGDDEGNVWIYNLKKIDFTSSNNDTKVIEAQNILRWPKLQDKYLKRTKKLEVDVYGIVIAKCAIHADGKYLVTVTDNNFVCLYSS